MVRTQTPSHPTRRRPLPAMPDQPTYPRRSGRPHRADLRRRNRRPRQSPTALHAMPQRKDETRSPSPSRTQSAMNAADCAPWNVRTIATKPTGVRASKSLASPALRTDAGSRLRICTGFHVFTKSPKPPEYQAKQPKSKVSTMHKKRVKSAYQRPGVVPPRSTSPDTEEPVSRRLYGSGTFGLLTEKA